MTAWVGLTDIAPVREGETVFISAAAGAVGSVAGQIAKARGCRVIGSAGGPAKVASTCATSSASTPCFDYRAIEPATRCARSRPRASTSTSTTSAARSSRPRSARCSRGGRIALCGAVSQYNATEPAPGPRNLGAARRQARQRCAASSSATTRTREGEFRGEVGGLIADGRLKLAETVVEGGLEAAPGAFIDMLRGKHLGKVVVAL